LNKKQIQIIGDSVDIMSLSNFFMPEHNFICNYRETRLDKKEKIYIEKGLRNGLTSL